MFVRRPYLAGNWKMNKLTAEAKALASEVIDQTKGTENKVLVAPPFTALHTVSEVIKGTHVLLGAQNMSDQESGAHTGEVSVHMLKDIGVSTVILGHSERRLVYGESDEFINRKVKLALANGLEVILCVGETLDQREAGEAEKVVEAQVRAGFDGISESDLSNIVIAYEPVWAIGTGKTATPEDADAIHSFIRKLLSELYSDKAAEEMIIQYGGSVKPNNVKDLMAKENIDGALVGGASLKSETFVPIVQFDK
ncbi:MAG: triose-phosphate isomerase [Spirochaetia bacterium]